MSLQNHQQQHNSNQNAAPLPSGSPRLFSLHPDTVKEVQDFIKCYQQAPAPMPPATQADFENWNTEENRDACNAAPIFDFSSYYLKR